MIGRNGGVWGLWAGGGERLLAYQLHGPSFLVGGKPHFASGDDLQCLIALAYEPGGFVCNLSSDDRVRVLADDPVNFGPPFFDLHVAILPCGKFIALGGDSPVADAVELPVAVSVGFHPDFDALCGLDDIPWWQEVGNGGAFRWCAWCFRLDHPAVGCFDALHGDFAVVFAWVVDGFFVDDVAGLEQVGECVEVFEVWVHGVHY